MEESDKAQASVIAVVPLMLVIMLTVLMLQLQSFSSMILVLSVAPMGVIGVVAALLLADKPLGFVAILGVLALKKPAPDADQTRAGRSISRRPRPRDSTVESSSPRGAASNEGPQERRNGAQDRMIGNPI